MIRRFGYWNWAKVSRFRVLHSRGGQPRGLYWHVNTLRPKQNGRRFADETFKHIFLNENVRISIKISLKFVPKGPVNNNPALVHIMAWRRSGAKPLSEPMIVSLLTHICVTWPQWVKWLQPAVLTYWLIQRSSNYRELLIGYIWPTKALIWKRPCNRVWNGYLTWSYLINFPSFTFQATIYSSRPHSFRCLV